MGYVIRRKEDGLYYEFLNIDQYTDEFDGHVYTNNWVSFSPWSSEAEIFPNKQACEDTIKAILIHTDYYYPEDLEIVEVV